MSRFYIKFSFIFLFIFCISCNSGHVYDKNFSIPKHTWNHENVFVFKPEVTDTVSIYNIYLHLRNTGEYPMSNLFLFIKTTSPLGYFVKDTFECVLADSKGKWMGKGFGNIWNNKILYKQYVKFPYNGIYTVEIEQAMRIKELEGIIDLGLSIEKAVD
ncbi:MAG: gliding motility lipoprotein GldH [Bacteroidales bacterium]|nr:gliding motility lipoprotein GldH [Bacteroidales bacterium]